MFIRLTLHGAVPTTTDGLSNPKNEDVNVKLLVSRVGANRLNISQFLDDVCLIQTPMPVSHLTEGQLSLDDLTKNSSQHPGVEPNDCP